MNNFDKRLLRLKLAVLLRTDQEVAAMLGLKKGAFCARRKNDSFPDEAVLALSGKRPELKLDVPYILTGVASPELAESKKNGHQTTPSKLGLTPIPHDFHKFTNQPV